MLRSLLCGLSVVTTLAPIVGQQAGKLLETSLRQKLAPLFDQRRKAVAGLRTADHLRAYQQTLRAKFRAVVGEFPAKTPLAARTVGRIERPRYTILRVIFESRRAHHVTANLYLPKGHAGRLPGVLVPCGHTNNGKAGDLYQSVCAELAQNGMVALCYDPIGQGERMQLLDKQGKPRVRGTTEHSLVGIGALLVGRHLAHYRIWDGIRAIDYLCSRPEVDPKRIGCTGNSGGGTMTSYLMAIDERIAVAAPSCYLTSLERVFATIGPQDAEQNFPSQVKLGIEHVDFVTMRAPKPTLILVATRDFFDIEGSWTCFREAKRLYGLLGRGECVDLFEFDDKHGFSPPRRHAAVRFLWRWLGAGTGEPSFPKLSLCKDAELQCTETGQVLRDIPDSRSVVDFNVEAARALAEKRGTCKARDIQRLVAYPSEHDGFPVAVTEDGSAAIRARVGDRVFGISVRGRGATTPKGRRTYGGWFGPDFHAAFLAMHAGETLLGLRCSDVREGLDTVAKLVGDTEKGVTLEADAPAQALALHAALFDPRVERVVLNSPLRSWASLVSDPVQLRRIGEVVPGALELYSLFDLGVLLRKRGCTVTFTQDALRKPPAKLPKSTPWNIASLTSKVPKFQWLDRDSRIRYLTYSGEAFKGKPTSVFAFYASPATLGVAKGSRSFPGIVLVHGGGGMAFQNWAELWAERGYAAIAMDLAGYGAGRKRLPDGGPGQSDREKFGAIDGPVTDQWTYHAVANVIRAHSLLRNFDEVKGQKTALTGISWGGYLTCIVAGLDQRFAVAMPVYGCGFLRDNSAWARSRFGKMTPVQADRWHRLWDPSRYIGSASMPVMFINGTNDFAYPMDSYAKTCALVRGVKNYSIQLRMRHGHIFGFPEFFGFVDQYILGETAMPVVSRPAIVGGRVRAVVESSTKLVSAHLHYTAGPHVDNRARPWVSLPMKIKAGNILDSVAPPAGATVWYVDVRDERKLLVSSELMVRNQ